MPLWKPNDLSSNTIWLKNPLSGTTWYDHSGSGNHAVEDSGTAPVKNVAAKNGKDTATFNGTSKYLKIADTNDPLDVGAEDFYVAAVANIEANTTIRSIFAKNRVYSDIEMRINASEYFIFAGPGSAASTHSNVLSGYHVLSAGRASGTVKSYVDGADEQSRSDTATLSQSTVAYVGARGTSGDANVAEKYFDSDIGEIVGFEGTVTGTADEDRVEGYLANRFGIALASHTYTNGPPTTCHCVAEKTLSTTVLSSNPRNPADLSEKLNIFDERR